MRLLTPILAALIVAAFAIEANANDRYGQRPPLVVSPDLSAPWVMQLTRAPQGRQVRGMRGARATPAPRQVTVRERRQVVRQQHVRQQAARQQAVRRQAARQQILRQQPRAQTVAMAPAAGRSAAPQMDPRFLPQTVDYHGSHKPGTIVIETATKYLYLVEAGGKARRYGVGVGKEGFMWSGTETITRKREWPDWRPPAEMIAREKKKGRILPAHMPGGPANPLGARALYLGSTLYRIHGTNAPWTIGGNVSSGCIRMRNEDVTDLYGRVGVGTKVVVI